MDNNNLIIKTVHVCRTCKEEIIINTSFFHLDFTEVDSEPTLGEKLSNCIPELDLNIIPNTVICGKCADTINSFHIFKKECLQSEMPIREYIEQATHAGSAVDLAAVMQFHQHQLHPKNLTAQLTTEVFENYKNEESPTSFSETEKYTEIANKEYLTSLQMVDRKCVLFKTVEDFINFGKSEAVEGDTHDNNIVQDCLPQVVENPDSSIQNLNKTDLFYQCFTCGHKAKSELKLIRHLKSHTDRKTISSKSRKTLCCRCNLCNYSTKHLCLFSFHNRAHLTKKNYQKILKRMNILVKPLKIQMLNHTREKPFNYSIYEYSCNRKYSLVKSHILTHTGAKTFRCSVCKYSCKQKQNLKSHMLTHTGEKSFKCSVCEYSFKQKSHLKTHLLTHTGEKPFRCSACEFSSNQKGNLKNHMLIHTGEKPFMCSVCEYSCNHKKGLKCHMLTHTGEKPFKCSVCEYSCNHKQNLERHMLTHTDEKPFRCSVCECSFKQKHHLKRHMLTHTAEKPFRCSVCEFSSKQKHNLKNHMLTHTGEKPFKCSVCGYSFKHKSNLKTHLLTHTAEKPFRCSACEYSCNHKNSLKIHTLIHVGANPFRCSVCEYSCKWKQNLKRHMLTHTSEQNF